MTIENLIFDHIYNLLELHNSKVENDSRLVVKNFIGHMFIYSAVETKHTDVVQTITTIVAQQANRTKKKIDFEFVKSELSAIGVSIPSIFVSDTIVVVRYGEIFAMLNCVDPTFFDEFDKILNKIIKHKSMAN